MRILAALLVVTVLAGCVSSHVRNGALIGAASGAAAGAGVGLLISDPDLLGSENTPKKGNMRLGVGETMAASAAIGVVFGAIVGGMAGHINEPRYGRKVEDTSDADGASPETAPDEPAPTEQGVRDATTIRF